MFEEILDLDSQSLSHLLMSHFTQFFSKNCRLSQIVKQYQVRKRSLLRRYTLHVWNNFSPKYFIGLNPKMEANEHLRSLCLKY